MSDSKHKYRVTRRINGVSMERMLTLRQMIRGDIVTIQVPPIGAIQLTEPPNNELIGRALPKIPSPKYSGAIQRIPTGDLEPDERGRIVNTRCSFSEGRPPTFTYGGNNKYRC